MIDTKQGMAIWKSILIIPIAVAFSAAVVLGIQQLGWPNPDTHTSLYVFFVYVLGMGLSLLTFYMINNFPTIRWSHWPASLILSAILLSLLLIPARLPLMSIVPVDEEFLQQFAEMIHFDVLGFLTICVGAALLEELIFRGIILEQLLKRYSFWTSIIVSSVLFGAVHLNPIQFVSATTLGIVIGWIYARSRSVWPGILIHFVNNSIPFIIGWWAQENGYEELNTQTEYPTWALLSGIPAILLLIPILRHMNQKLPFIIDEESENLVSDHQI